jgi:deoxyribodipyrimidine photo-lyase
MIDEQRITLLNEKPLLRERSFIVYWMQASQRVRQNEALSYAIENANALRKPLIVYFGLVSDFPQATRRHYAFMLEGLKEVEASLAERNIPLFVCTEGMIQGLSKLAEHMALLVVDASYSRLERSWRSQASRIVACACHMVEANVVVPLRAVTDKEEYSAATLRRKIEPMISYFAQKVEIPQVQVSSLEVDCPFSCASLHDVKALLDSLHLKKLQSNYYRQKPGEKAALERLASFIEHSLDGYSDKRNDPALDHASELSAYLHFGQISSITIYHAVKDIDLEDVPAFLEQLIVRRELACNYVFFNPYYDRYEGLPSWARASLDAHAQDPRPVTYTYDQLEAGETHDRYWNAAQHQLVRLGTMHNYMRMYWGKKILQWSNSAPIAFETALSLNNTYQMDGRDPNGYAGVAWCFGKHDRPWVERPIFGSIRYMNDKGLERKFNMQRYIKKVEKEIEATIQP